MYIITPSFPSLFYAIHKFYLKEDVTLITSSLSVHKIACELEINCIYLNIYSGIIGKIKSKFTLNKLLKKLNLDQNIFLFDNIHCIEGFYLLSKWTLGNTYYTNLSFKHDEYIKRLTIKQLIKKRLVNQFFQLDLCYKNQNENPFLGINDVFLKKNRINNYIVNNFNSIKLGVINKAKINIPQFNSILILQGTLKGIIEPSSISKVFKELELIKSLVIKEHPTHITKSKNISKIPNYYPVELCFNSISTNIISIYSSSLIIASQLQNKNSISLLDLVQWMNESYKDSIKKLLITESNNKIHFPKSFPELRNLLKHSQI